MKNSGQRNFAVSKETESKLFQLRNYHNATYNKLFEIMVENAFSSMNEAINLNKGKELEEQNLKVGFQVQQLTLMFSELKKENAILNTKNEELEKRLDVLTKHTETNSEKTNNSISSITKNLTILHTNCENSFKKVEKHYNELDKWVNKKDSSFSSKITNLFKE